MNILINKMLNYLSTKIFWVHTGVNELITQYHITWNKMMKLDKDYDSWTFCSLKPSCSLITEKFVRRDNLQFNHLFSFFFFQHKRSLHFSSSIVVNKIFSSYITLYTEVNQSRIKI